MLDGMSDSIQWSRIENLHSREVDCQSPTGLILFFMWHKLKAARPQYKCHNESSCGNHAVMCSWSCLLKESSVKREILSIRLKAGREVDSDSCDSSLQLANTVPWSAAVHLLLSYIHGHHIYSHSVTLILQTGGTGVRGLTRGLATLPRGATRSL